MGAFDIQVNGFAGVDFNADVVSCEEMAKVEAALGDDGVDGVLATVITAEIGSMERRVRRLAEFCDGGGVFRGIHIEGPFLNPAPGYVGAHPAEHVVPATVGVVARLVDAGGGHVRLVTLAPEKDEGLKVTRWLVERGIRVAAGHCDPTLDQLRGAADAGLSLFTHLGNGCPPVLHRHDNIIQRALSLSDRLWICLIADGHHLPLYVLRNLIRAAGVGRCIAVTDAMSAAGAPAGSYPLAGKFFEVGDDRVVRVPGTDQFAGSAARLPDLRENLRAAGFSEEDVKVMAEENPRRALNLEF